MDGGSPIGPGAQSFAASPSPNTSLSANCVYTLLIYKCITCDVLCHPHSVPIAHLPGCGWLQIGADRGPARCFLFPGDARAIQLGPRDGFLHTLAWFQAHRAKARECPGHRLSRVLRLHLTTIVG